MGGGLSKWLQYYIGGGLAKWLQYYIGVVRQMITVLRRGGLANDYGIPWILGFYIRNIISKDLTKKVRVVWIEFTCVLWSPCMKFVVLLGCVKQVFHLRVIYKDKSIREALP